MTEQIPLSIHLNNQLTIDNFCWGDNAILQQAVNKLLEGSEQFLYVWGEMGVGKSHLLQACCQAENLNQRHAIYLPLHILKMTGPDCLEDLDHFHLIAIDDIDIIAGDPPWEEALFHLYNRVRDNQTTRLIISAAVAPNLLTIQLPDLRSRLSWGLSLPIKPLSDEHKVAAIRKMAWCQGIDLPEKVAHFLMARTSRNMHDLAQHLHTLDRASLAAKRKLTVPFVKQTLNL
ncbi:DnaA regulatory inactivator Hda [Legionella sp. W05-934-2]|jgi:DnaA family protein|uniref:DnaA regulatory inactivator Hda n=1 Tax=Legionella sp. W05-934-2 TaxID=1198649 RepID=UPI0034626B33